MPACLRMARSVPSGISPGVVRDGGEAVSGRVMPDIMTSGGLAMELKPERLQSAGECVRWRKEGRCWVADGWKARRFEDA